MYINIKNSFPGFSSLCFYSGINVIEELYNALDKKNEDVILNPLNIDKINNFFNDHQKNKSISEALLQQYGLIHHAIPKNVFILEYILESNRYINSLSTSHCIQITDKNIIEYINNSKQHFYDMIKDSDRNNIISRYSLRSSEYINVDSLSFNEKTKRISVSFSIDYMLEKNDYKYFDFFRDKKCYFKANVDSYDKVRISMKTQYTKQGKNNE